MKFIKEIFEPICPEKFTEFLDILEGTQPDFDELTDWEELSEREKAGVILQFSLVTQVSIYTITEKIYSNA